MAVSVREVAAAASVSVGTVSNVLNRPEKVAPETVERVLSVIEELGYVRNDAARQLRAGRSRTIGLIVLDVGNPFFAEVARGAEDRAAEAGMSVLLGNSDESAQREASYLDLFREQRVNGVLITPAGERIEPLQHMQDAGVPVVLVDREAPGTSLRSVAVDDVEGGFLAVQHLLSGGRTRIAYVCGPRSIRQVADRLAGAQRAIAAVPGAQLEVIEVPGLTVLQGRAAGEQLVARPREERPDAVFAANDLLAVGLLQALQLMGDLRVPDDIALIGYDDIDFASATVVPLSSIRQPAHLIGYTAVDLLLRHLAAPAGQLAAPGGASPASAGEDERNVRFQPELVIRASTAG